MFLMTTYVVGQDSILRRVLRAGSTKNHCLACYLVEKNVRNKGNLGIQAELRHFSSICGTKASDKLSCTCILCLVTWAPT